jgi:D-amino-acid dehydrogenase
MAADSVPYQILDRAGCVSAEPALSRTQDLIVGGLRLPGDETGDAHIFTQRLAAMCENRGVAFRFHTSIRRLEADAERVTGVQLSTGEHMTAHAYVVALGSFSRRLLDPHGIRLPIYPVKGYSLTIPIIDPDAATVSTIVDETFKVAITRLGGRIRVGGTAELAGFSTRLRAPRRATLERSVGDLFPRGGDVSKAAFWAGLRPMTPDGTRIVGRARLNNLFVNAGHGTLGWTMACGSARLLADLISAKPPEIDPTDLGPARYTAAG